MTPTLHQAEGRGPRPPLLRSRALAALAAAALLGTLVPAPALAAPTLAEKIAKLRSRYEAIHGQLEDIARPFARDAFETIDTDLVSRWIDAKVFFDSGSIGRAGMLLAALVEDPRFQKLGSYHEALFMLGQVQYRMGNHEGARKTFADLRKAGAPASMLQSSLYYMLDSALKLRRADEAAEYLRAAEQLPAPSPELLYVAGKAYFFAKNLKAAVRRLALVPAGSRVFAQAQYYLGVARTALGELNDARSSFLSVLNAAKDSSDPAQREIHDLAVMALGRIAVEGGAWLEAVDHYQRIPRGSRHYPRSVYELAWAYVNAGKYREAIRAFDVIPLVSHDERLVLTAGMDRGRLLIFLQQYPEAQESFEDVIRRFVPVRNELDRFARSDRNLELYFSWLIHRYDERFALDLPLSKRASRWVEQGEGIEDVIEIFDDVAHQHRDIGEIEQLAEDLRTALTGSDRVALFPALGDAWIRLLALENQLIAFKRLLLDTQHTAHAESLDASRRETVARLRTRARELESRFGELPTSSSGYQKRMKKMTSRFRAVQREAFHVSRALEELKGDLLSIDRFIKELEFTADDSPAKGAASSSVQQALQKEKEKLHRMTREIETVERQLRNELAHSGLGGRSYRTEEELKTGLLQVYRSLEVQYPSKRATEDVLRMHSALWADLERIAKIRGVIDRRLDAESRKLLAQVDFERTRIRSYRDRASKLSERSEGIARDVGHALFREANARIRQTVLHADLGIVDLAWDRKHEVTAKIDSLRGERAKKIEEVKRVLDEMLKVPQYRPLKETPPEPSEPPRQPGRAPGGAEPGTKAPGPNAAGEVRGEPSPLAHTGGRS